MKKFLIFIFTLFHHIKFSANDNNIITTPPKSQLSFGNRMENNNELSVQNSNNYLHDPHIGPACAGSLSCWCCMTKICCSCSCSQAIIPTALAGFICYFTSKKFYSKKN